MKLIVGLGNPGKKYDNTRHNIGFMLVDKYLSNPGYKDKFNADYYKTVIFGEDVIFIKPKTYMNLSGDSVLKFVKYYDVDINNVLVIQDDLDMIVGTFKLKRSSSAGGHNGIKSVISNLNTNEFARLKIGVLNETKSDTIDFVLGSFSKDDLNKINLIDTNFIIDLFIKEGFEQAIKKYKV